LQEKVIMNTHKSTQAHGHMTMGQTEWLL